MRGTLSGRAGYRGTVETGGSNSPTVPDMAGFTPGDLIALSCLWPNGEIFHYIIDKHSIM